MHLVHPEVAEQLHQIFFRGCSGDKATFALKEGPRPSNFIIEDNLRALGLALGEDPQVALAAGPFAATPPLATNVLKWWQIPHVVLVSFSLLLCSLVC